jgi:hypothetical protein
MKVVMKVMKHQITATKILVEWNDNPKMEILFNEMPSDLEQLYNKWLESIEHERNIVVREISNE